MKVYRHKLALVRESDHETYDGRRRLSTPGTAVQVAAEIFGRLLDGEPQEVMLALALDQRHRLVGFIELHRGTLARAAVEPRQALSFALLANAAHLILAHNHPSGDPSPSAEDLAYTCRLGEAGAIVGVQLLDHLVIGSDGRWTSLRSRGAL